MIRTRRLQDLISRGMLRIVCAALCWAALVAAPAKGYVYFAGHYGEAIHRMNLDGSHVDLQFIPNAPASALAVNSSRLFWFDTNTNAPINNGTGHSSVGEANLDGSHVNRELVLFRQMLYPRELAANNSFVWFGNIDSDFNYNPIGRATIAGTGVEPLFVNDGSDWNHNGGPLYLAVAGAYLYWIDNSGNIGRSGVDGSGQNDHYLSRLPKVSQPGGFTAAGGYLYWTTSGGIARIGIDGHGLDARLIRTGGSPGALAVFKRHIYWGDGTALRRSDLDGSHVKTLHRDPRFDTVNAIAVGGGG